MYYVVISMTRLSGLATAADFFFLHNVLYCVLHYALNLAVFKGA